MFGMVAGGISVVGLHMDLLRGWIGSVVGFVVDFVVDSDSGQNLVSSCSPKNLKMMLLINCYTEAEVAEEVVSHNFQCYSYILEYCYPRYQYPDKN